jgi:hypothetical protein
VKVSKGWFVVCYEDMAILCLGEGCKKSGKSRGGERLGMKR